MSPHTDPGALLKLAEAHAWNWNCKDHAAPSMLVDFVKTIERTASQGRAGGEQSEVQTSDALRLLQEASCFGHEVCPSLPCHCAETIAARGVAQEARECATCHAILADGPQPAATYVAQEASDRGAEIKRLRAQVEYWRLAAERREARMERSGVDVAEARTLDTPSVPSASSPAQARQERHEATYLRGWNEGIECAVEALEKEGWYTPQDTIRKLVEASPVPSAQSKSPCVHDVKICLDGAWHCQTCGEGSK